MLPLHGQEIMKMHSNNSNPLLSALRLCHILILKETEVVTDASPYGLSAIRTQTTPGKDDSKVIAYVSRSLTPVERRYSQTESEVYIVWDYTNTFMAVFYVK